MTELLRSAQLRELVLSSLMSLSVDRGEWTSQPGPRCRHKATEHSPVSFYLNDRMWRSVRSHERTFCAIQSRRLSQRPRRSTGTRRHEPTRARRERMARATGVAPSATPDFLAI